MGIKVKKKSEKLEMLKNLKRDTTFEVLLEGYPQEFIDYMNHVRNLEFDEKPDCNYLKKNFENLLQKNGYEFDYQYDWVIKKQARMRELGNPIVEEEYKVPVDKTTLSKRKSSRNVRQGSRYGSTDGSHDESPLKKFDKD